MQRRAILAAMAAAGVAGASLPFVRSAAAQTQTQTDATYRAVAHWLFDLYLQRSIELTIFNATRAQPAAQDVLVPRLPAMRAILARHREPFAAAIDRPLRTHVSVDAASQLAKRIASPTPVLDDAMRERLTAVDAEFRRDSQSVIRAITADLGTMVADTLAATATGSIR
jgi:hypothetical protein